MIKLIKFKNLDNYWNNNSKKLKDKIEKKNKNYLKS